MTRLRRFRLRSRPAKKPQGARLPGLRFSHKTFRIKRFLAKKQKQNRPIPQWIRMKTGNKIRYNSKRRHWRRTKLGL
ncbi:60S ribosomal protein L39-like [Nomascus leucogenys]|uniref:60S ribosomal protein L39-like n=1 Tax=Nomascus leucogenys TaxID=61853 RepID=UPI00122D7B9E|nr:60S ribosomal protein L39-like [Nomascus leucogenys]